MQRPPYKKIIVLPDMQVPFQDSITLSAVEAYMADERWDEYINLGDFVDFDMISKFSEGLPGLVQGKTIAKAIGEANIILDRHVAAARKKNPKCKKRNKTDVDNSIARLHVHEQIRSVHPRIEKKRNMERSS